MSQAMQYCYPMYLEIFEIYLVIYEFDLTCVVTAAYNDLLIALEATLKKQHQN